MDSMSFVRVNRPAAAAQFRRYLDIPQEFMLN